jgi:hypothetical protein
VNWVTKASFAPPLVPVGVKADSHSHPIIKESGSFALNVLGKDQGRPVHEGRPAPRAPSLLLRLLSTVNVSYVR